MDDGSAGGGSNLVGGLMSGAVPEVCRRQRGSMHTLARRRCTPTVLLIRRCGNVLRLRRARARGAGAALAVEGSDPRGTEARFGRGAVRVFARSSPPPSGVAPLESSLREGVRNDEAVRFSPHRPRLAAIRPRSVAVAGWCYRQSASLHFIHPSLLRTSPSASCRFACRS